MELISQLEELFYHAQNKPEQDDLRLQGWRILIHESKAVSLGIKENMPGSVYTPPSYRQGESGEVFLVWSDGRCSQAKVQSLTQDKDIWRVKLKEWRDASYIDPEGIDIPLPSSLPLVAVEDRAVYKILKEDDKLLFAQMESLLNDRPKVIKLQGNVQAAWGYRHIRTSTGLTVSYQESYYALSYSFDRLVGANFAKRRLIEENEWKQLWDQTIDYHQAIMKEAPSVKSGTTVILTPSVVEQMMEQYLLPNFSGQSVLEGRSAFHEERFRAKEKVFNENLSLIIDPLRPLEWGSYLATSEGVAAQKTVLVKNGQLQIPYLKVKDARRWGEKPTAVPNGTSGIYLAGNDERQWAEALKDIEDGVLILSVLGLHTQDSVSGRYSISAPQSLRIIKGRIVGKTDVKLTGNFLDDLSKQSSIYARSTIASQPYLLIKTGVENL